MNSFTYSSHRIPPLIRDHDKYVLCVDLRKHGVDWRWSELLNRHGTTHLYNYSNCAYHRCLICLMPDYGYAYTLRNRYARPIDDAQDHDWVYHTKDPDNIFIVPLLECTRCYKMWVTPEYAKTQKIH